MRFLFRTDSSLNIGSGHIMRCLTLANELKKYGADISFVCRNHKGNLINKVETAGYRVYRLKSYTSENYSGNDYSLWLGVTQEEDAHEILSVIGKKYFDWVIVDHYAIDEIWERMIRQRARKIMVIDDLANRKHDCDFLLDQNYFGAKTPKRYNHLVSPTCHKLLGPRYALLQPEYKYFRKRLNPHNGTVKTILIFFGGSDKKNLTEIVLNALNCDELKEIKVNVVIGSNYCYPEKIRRLVSTRANTFLFRNLSTLAHLIKSSDLMIGAGGATTWERMCLGIPTVASIISENQKEMTLALSNETLQISVNDPFDMSVNDWKELIGGMIRQPFLIQTFSNQSKKYVDGHGVERVISFIYKNAPKSINIRKANEQDEGLLLSWVNDSTVRRHSFSKKSIAKEEHSAWFQSKINDPYCYVFIGEDEQGLPIGQVRFEVDIDKLEASIDISIDPCFRGSGLSKQLLTLALSNFRCIMPNLKIIAEVLLENSKSHCLFLSLNFREISSRRANSKTYELVI
ncbi:UDP-2,4-diacetamido-2,4,6-trideoxy-beta-L-altropyranose hydrolase [Legionella impletisoli]|uniref:N-acetyltransferase domain-containing protein n=1 Tax=Legionella impletisoli TaxID=343510 RepID=A0A917JR45_9GAMM|nr:UDP-2,4-diacetamido-2,4,6-trideoxy-beta-L-altropyranose hydrolase [Legionella impletisoli]GGI82105.1 hypothetical protein GCM10007966_08370 [Legionella impletisoli]